MAHSPVRSAGPPAAERRLRTIERDELARRPTEKAIFFAPRGSRVFERTDHDPRQVRLGPKDVERMCGLVMTHNHPGGRSLSLDDVDLAVCADLVEVRAVGMALGVAASGQRVPVAHRLLRPPGGWPPIVDIAATYERHSETVFGEFWARIDDGRLSRRLANALHLHEVWIRVARALDLRYERTPLDD
jgi:hypothetical protein